MNYFVYIDNILGIKTNLEKFRCSYGSQSSKSTRNNFLKCKFKVFINLKSSNEILAALNKEKNLINYHYYLGKYNSSKIYYKRRVLKMILLLYSVEIKGDNLIINVNKNYLNYIKFRIMGLHSISYIVDDFISALLLKNGFLSLYCAAVSKDKKATLIFGPSNTGKTITTINLCQGNRYRYMSEDISLTNGKEIWGIPWTTSYRNYKNTGKGNKVPLGIDSINFQKRETKTEIDKIITIERGGSNISFDKVKGKNRVLNLQRFLFYYHKSPSLIAFSYFNNCLSPIELFKREKNIIDKIIDEKYYIHISKEKATDFSEIIKGIDQGTLRK